MDLSYAAAKKLGYAEKGTARVQVEALTFDSPQQPILAENKSPTYVQVGAYQQQKTAEQVKLKVAQLTHQTTRVQPITVKDKTLYRVQVGPIAHEQKMNISNQLLTIFSQL